MEAGYSHSGQQFAESIPSYTQDANFAVNTPARLRGLG